MSEATLLEGMDLCLGPVDAFKLDLKSNVKNL